MAGSGPTPEEKKLIFSEEFLRTGSVVYSARKSGIPERTARRLAGELEEDSDFLAARGRLHKNALARAEAAVLRSIDVLSDRIENATELLGNEDEGVRVLDKAADYGRAIASLNDSLLKRRKLEDDVAARLEGKGEGTGPVEVTIKLTQDKASSVPQD